MTAPWLDAARSIPLAQVAAELGIERSRGGHLGPCPACGEQTRSRHDSRLGSIFLVAHDQRWRCQRCDAHGDGLELALLAIGCEFGDLRAWYAARGWCEPAPDRPAPPRVVPRPPPPPPPPRHPSAEAIRELWDLCRPVLDDPAVATWLRSRGLDPGLVEDRCLARALPDAGPLGPWAAWYGHGYRCVFGLVDQAGDVVTLRARRVGGEDPPKVRALPDAPSAVLADGTARALLRGEAWLAAAGAARVYVTEGEPDWLTRATWAGEVDSAPAVFGIGGAGAWPAWLGDRIPGGWTVHVDAHVDEAGQRMLARVSGELEARCTIVRSAARGAA